MPSGEGANSRIVPSFGLEAFLNNARVIRGQFVFLAKIPQCPKCGTVSRSNFVKRSNQLIP